MIAVLWALFIGCAVALVYMLGVERGREDVAIAIESDEWFKTADPAAARYAAQIARRQADG